MNVNQDRAKSILVNAAEIASAAEREAYLVAECGGDEALRREVADLLRHHDEARAFLESPAVAPAATIDEPIREGPGTVIGQYKLLEQIGEGGFGVVFMAEQTQPVRRKVALKVLKPGMDTRQVVARFEAERQALAIMDHPNIAKVFDGGTTGEKDEGGRMKDEKEADGRSDSSFRLHRSSFGGGRPYFVMELVKGVPITEFCDHTHLTPRQRLQLFIPVCQAVQHAHHKGIIHRDLKPSNVLVTVHDTTPVPKVIDFGVAKALGQELTDKSLFTGIAQMIGTPLYMSPEQAGQSGLDIDTRSDIYSLGVLLYELLTGTTPFSKERFKQAAYDEIRRIIREEDPPKPSTRLSESKDSLPAISAQRQTEPAKLTRLVRGELDWIVMKALEKDRNRRYETANGFAQDVQRYLADEPVQACPPSVGYRLKKFARRNKPALAVAGLILFCIVLLGAGAWAYQQDKSARDVAVAARRAETERAVTAALAQAEMLLAEGDKQTDHPERWKATMQLSLASVDRAKEVLTTGEATEELAGRVRQVRDTVDAAVTDSCLLVELDRIRLEQAAVKAEQFDLARAAPLYAEALGDYGIDLAAPEAAAARVRASRLRAALLAALREWAHVTSDSGEKQRLKQLVQAADPESNEFRARLRAGDVAALVRLVDGPEMQALPAATVAALAHDLWYGANDLAAAERLLRAGQERYPNDFWLNHKLGMVLLELKPPRAEEAVRYLTAALALRSDSPGVHLNLGLALSNNGDVDGAIRRYRAALQVDPYYAMAHNNLGTELSDKGLVDEAIGEYRKAIELKPKDGFAYNNLGNALAKQGKLDEAIAACRKAVELEPRLPQVHNSLGGALAGKGRLDEAITEYRHALKLKPDYAKAHLGLGSAFVEQGKLEEAIAEFRQALQINANLAEAHNSLGGALARKGRLDEAIAECRHALKLKPDYADAHTTLGIAFRAQRKLEEAIAEFRQAILLNPKLPEAHNNLAAALRDQGHLADAIAEMTKAIELKPHYYTAYDNLGVMLAQQGELNKAIAAFQQAIKLKPDFAQAHDHLGQAFLEQDKVGQAVAEHRLAIKLKPNFAEAHHNLAVALERQGKLDDSIAELREAIKLKPDYAQAHYNLGWGLARKGQHNLDEAILEYRKCLGLTPDYVAAHYHLGNALRQQGKLEEAVQAYREAIKLKPHYAEAHCNLGHTLRDTGQFAEALVHMKRGHELGSRNPRWPYASAQWVKECERLVELDARLSGVLAGKQAVADVQERIDFARICSLKRRFEQATRFYEQALAQEPRLAEDSKSGHRYNAACNAALAGIGEGKEASTLNDEQRARRRRQALDWLRDDLQERSRALENAAPAVRAAVVQSFQHWLRDPDLRGLREDAHLAKLPAEERETCGRLWSQVRELVKVNAAKK